MDETFHNLSTEQFRKHMQPFAWDIYKFIYPGSHLVDIRTDSDDVHILDKYFAIDTLWTLSTGQWYSLQEKYRQNKYLTKSYFQTNPPYPDFTQEYMNAVGTPHESLGEWFRLGAQLYFYGWANAKEDGFDKWVILDIVKYKSLVERSGGLDKIGKLYQNGTHGKATFYAISIEKLKPAILLEFERSEFC